MTSYVTAKILPEVTRAHKCANDEKTLDFRHTTDKERRLGVSGDEVRGGLLTNTKDQTVSTETGLCLLPLSPP